MPSTLVHSVPHGIVGCRCALTERQDGGHPAAEPVIFVAGHVVVGIFLGDQVARFVDDAELVGRAVRVWFHFKPFGDDWGLHGDRIGVPVG